MSIGYAAADPLKELILVQRAPQASLDGKLPPRGQDLRRLRADEEQLRSRTVRFGGPNQMQHPVDESEVRISR